VAALMTSVELSKYSRTPTNRLEYINGEIVSPLYDKRVGRKRKKWKLFAKNLWTAVQVDLYFVAAPKELFGM
jgi:hypothetical protein